MNENSVLTCLIVAVGMALRAGVSLNQYSGAGKPPLFGDFEAQRHWQEVTINLPMAEWYEETADNDLQYWGLDYPPLTAYHSLINGIVGKRLNESYVELEKSRGISTEEHKFFMRCTVFVADLLVYLPCVMLAIQWISKRGKLDRNSMFFNIFVAVTFPGQILIDNGHFQYNNVSLGLAMLSVALMVNKKYLWGALSFTLALNYKQMELYHALPIFFYLLAQCTPGLSDERLNLTRGVKRLALIGSVVVGTTFVVYLPWLRNLESIKQVLHRLFPIARGVFEDKVANFWCILNVFYKVKIHFTNEEMAKVCLFTTLGAVLPTNLHLFCRPTWKNFLHTLCLTSLGFFLFSFQVHEKSILLVTSMVLLKMATVQDRKWTILFLQTATFSMTPLLKKDGLLIPFLGLSAIFLGSVYLLEDFMNENKAKNKLHKFGETLCWMSIVTQMGLVLALSFVTPPPRWPFLFELLIAAFSATHFLLYFLYFYVEQFFLNVVNVKVKSKNKIK